MEYAKENGSRILERISGLAEDQRAAAFRTASMRIAGHEPVRSAFDAEDYSRFPAVVNYAINALAFAFLLVAFLPSAMRIHALALDTYNVTHETSRYIAALCVVMMSEVGQVIFSLALAKAHGRSERLGYAFGAIACTLFALAGNAVAVGDHAFSDLFAFLETFAPPVLTIICAQVLKSQTLHAIADRHAAARAYDKAVRDWRSAYDNAQQSPKWMRMYATALKDEIRTANKRSARVIREITDDEWLILIKREMDADAWYERAEQRAQTHTHIEPERITQPAPMPVPIVRTQAPVRTGISSGQYTGEAVNAVRMIADGEYVSTCPHCAETFVRDTHKGAVNALAAHVGRWCKMRPTANAYASNGNGNGHKES